MADQSTTPTPEAITAAYNGLTVEQRKKLKVTCHMADSELCFVLALEPARKVQWLAAASAIVGGK